MFVNHHLSAVQHTKMPHYDSCRAVVKRRIELVAFLIGYVVTGLSAVAVVYAIYACILIAKTNAVLMP